MRSWAAIVTLAISAVISVVAAGIAPRPAAAPRVQIWRVPDAGIQPQAVVDAAGAVHVLFFKGAPAGGDLYYTVRGPSAESFSTALRVNSVPGSVLASGTVRGGQLALGAKGRVHAAWYGAKELDGPAKQRPVWHARLAADQTRFEPQINVATGSTGIDGATVAADARGNVYVAWHAQGSKDGEANRTVYVATSKDAGATFARAAPTSQASTGACACCGLRALVDTSRSVHILFRTATDGVYRNAAWLTLSAGPGSPVVLQPWKLDACPMSTFALTQAGPGLAAAWETEQQIYYARLDPATRTFSTPLMMDGPAGRKHPSIATGADGTTLVAWTEGTGWARGGTLAWQAIDRGGSRLGAQTDAAPVPVWGLVAAVALRDGSFAILH